MGEYVTDAELLKIFQQAEACVQVFSQRHPHVHLSNADWNDLVQAVDVTIWRALMDFIAEVRAHVATKMETRGNA